MKKVVEFLTENQKPSLYFATVGLDGKAKVRPFQFMMEEAGKLIFCTSNQKSVYQELKKNPYGEFCISSPRFEWIRLSGKIVFLNDIHLKEKVLQTHPFVKNIYKTADNPIFEIFYLDEAKAVISDFSGNPSQEYLL